jgi:hypothetical protein
MDQTRSVVMRRNLFRAGAAFGTAAAIWVVSSGAHAEGRKRGLWNGVGPDGDGPPGLEGRQPSGNCFLRGTLILTPAGHRPVEELQAGDLLVSRFAGISPIVRIVRWQGDTAPIRIKSGTLDGQREDLVLTEHHAVLIEDCLVAAGNLVNGKTIVREPCQAREFFNVRLESHDVVIAQNAPCESLYFEAEGEEPCLPRYRYRSLRGEATGYLRSALSPVVDLRNRADLIRDRLDLAA